MWNKCGAMKAFLGAAAFALAGCGDANHSTEDVGDFFYDHERDFLSWIQRDFDSARYEQIIHIDFRPNDFGYLADSEDDSEFTKNTPVGILRGHGPFAQETLPETASALKLRTLFPDQRVIASLQYRHSSADKAAEAFKHLFGCRNGTSQTHGLTRTFILGSAGSHGADEIENFSSRLFRACGRKLDFVILGDAISKPGPFPKTSFRYLEREGACLNFYQRKDLLAGLPIDHCINVKVESRLGHAATAELGLKVATFILDRLDTTKEQWSLAPIQDLTSSVFFSYSDDFYGYFSKWFRSDYRNLWKLILKPDFIFSSFAVVFIEREWELNSFGMKRSLNQLKRDELEMLLVKLWRMSDQTRQMAQAYIDSHPIDSVRHLANEIPQRVAKDRSFRVSQDFKDLIRRKVPR